MNSPFPACRILNVNDDPAVRRAISRILARSGWVVTESENAAGALREIAKEQPDLALLDVNLADMDGYQLCAQIRQNPQAAHLPVVFLSALSKDDASRSRGLDCGADGYVTWPVNQEFLAATIKSVLRLRHAEARLRESEERFRATFEQAAIGLGHVTIEGQWTWVNSRLCQILGYSLEELLQQTCLDVAFPEDLPALVEHKRMLVAGETDSFIVEQRCRRKDAAWIWTRWTVTLAGKPGGVPQHFVAVVEDMTKRRESDRRFHQLLRAAEQTASTIFITDRQGNIEYANPTFAETTGWSVEEALGKNPRILKSGSVSPATYAELWRTITAGEAWRGEFLNKKKNGELYWESATISPVPDEHGVISHYVAVKEDITKQKAAQEALAQSEARFRTLFDLAPDGIYLVDMHGSFVEGNQAAEQLIGYPKEELIGKSFLILNLLSQPDLLRAAAGLDRNAQGEATGPEEFVLNRKDGRQVPVEVRAFPITLGKQPLVLGVARDITERKRAEQALRERERQLATLMSNLPGMAYRCRNDREWTMEFVSDGAKVLTGYSASDLTGNSVVAYSKLIDPADREAVWSQVQASLERRESFVLHYRLRKATGDECWVWEQGRGIFDAQNQLVALEGFITDVTERKRAEDALRESEERFRRAVAEAPIPIMIHDESDQVLQLSKGWTLCSGYTADDLQTLGDWTERAYGARTGSAKDYIDQLFKIDRTTANGEWTITARDGTKRVWDFQTTPLGRLSGGKRVLQSLALDITDRKRAEQDRAAREAQMRQQQKLESIGTLAGGVAHEINNPINGIMNYAQLIQDRLPAGSPAAEYAGEILHETHRVAAIVRNLLAFARDEKQSHSPARIEDIIEGTLSLIRTVIRRDQITLTVNLPRDLPNLKCRSQQIEQVLMNLMTNARDALNERYPGHDPDKALNISAGLIEKQGRRWIRVTVKDHGTGIAPEVRERMFDPFFTTKPRDKGTGLGLAISHGIVKEHDGQLWFETELGQGTRFHIDLPLETADDGWKI